LHPTVQTDGRILVAGLLENSSGTWPFILRYNPDGSLDGTFGSSGRFIQRRTDKLNPSPERTLLEFIRYNNWANWQVLQACLELGDDPLDAAIPGAYGTIRETLGHILRAEAYYVDLLTGSRPQPPFSREDRPDLDTIMAYQDQVASALEATVNSVDPAKVIREVDEGQEYFYQALAVYIQVINHGIEHRTNITTLLNQGLQKPPEVDGWGYLSAHMDRFEPK
jgi:uncharacterized damage-inducible protein DinB